MSFPTNFPAGLYGGLGGVSTLGFLSVHDPFLRRRSQRSSAMVTPCCGQLPRHEIMDFHNVVLAGRRGGGELDVEL